MCENFPNIRVTEGNAFALLLPLRTRTYVSSQPIDEDIDYTQLENIVFTFGGVEYATEATEQGVKIILPDTLAVGTYNAILTAEYLGNDIRAAYESAVTIVPWSEQSSAEQYIVGSPIVMRAAYVLSGAMTDAELEALKEEYREKNAQLQQAIEDAEAAKREWEQKAADLEGVAKESTSQQILYKIDNIDFSTLAKEATLGTPLAGQPSTIFAAIAALGGGDDTKQIVVDAIIAAGGTADTSMTWAQLATAIEQNPIVPLNGSELASGFYASNIDIAELFAGLPTAVRLKDKFRVLRTDKAFAVVAGAFRSLTRLEEVYFTNATIASGIEWTFAENLALKKLIIPRAVGGGRIVQSCKNIEVLDISSFRNQTSAPLYYNLKLIDIITGANFNSDTMLVSDPGYFAPTEVYRTDSNSLCYASDLVDYGQIFNTNFDKWKWCIINHFAANLPDRTGQTAFTIRFGNAVSHFDTDMASAFTNKNWTIVA